LIVLFSFPFFEFLKMSVDRSDKLKWQVYEPSVYEAPYLVYYMKQSADNFTSSGYSFNIKTPALGALLDPEAYISYSFKITQPDAENIQDLIYDRSGLNPYSTDPSSSTPSIAALSTASVPAPSMFPHPRAIAGLTQWDGTTSTRTSVPGAIRKFAFRQANIFQRAIQQIVLTVNGFTLNSEPWKWIDPLNRLMVSNSQSKHVFSGSGGAFDSGNHGLRNEIDNIAVFQQREGAYNSSPAMDAHLIPISGKDWTASIQQGFNFYPSLHHEVSSTAPKAVSATWAADLTTGAQVGANNAGHTGLSFVNKFPNSEHFYNKGFSDRIFDMLRKLRGDYRGDGNAILTGIPDGAASVNSVHADYFRGSTDNDYWFQVVEPIPLPPFKMYHNDGVGGVIPHVRDMTLRATFTANLLNNLFMANYDIEDAELENDPGGFKIDFENVNSSHCVIMMKWYLPPPSIQIPREISIPLRKIDMYLSSSATQLPIIGINNQRSAAANISQYNISLDAIPDLLMIYFRLRNDIVRAFHPCDYMMEMQNLTLQLENNGGKLTQMQTYQMYQNWLKYIKFDDPPEMTYDEWRKYNCVALLKPDDYGAIRGPGWDNVVVLGVTFNAYNYHHNPSIGLCPSENLSTAGAQNSGISVSGTNVELVVVAIFDRWHLTLSADGTARANLTRIRDLGNALPAAM
jgi:hypothetical protein